MNKNKQQTFIEWLEDFILQLEDAEAPVAKNEYDDGYNWGCLQTQDYIVSELKYGLRIYKSEILNKKKENQNE